MISVLFVLAVQSSTIPGRSSYWHWEGFDTFCRDSRELSLKELLSDPAQYVRLHLARARLFFHTSSSSMNFGGKTSSVARGSGRRSISSTFSLVFRE